MTVIAKKRCRAMVEPPEKGDVPWSNLLRKASGPL
jgi:hypothetical protein